MTVVDINFFLHLFSLSTAYDTLTSILLPTIAFCRPKPITPASARERTPVPLRRWRGDFRSEIDRANFLRAKALYLRVSFFFFSSSRCVTFACPKGWMCKKWEGLKRPGRFPEAALRFRPSSAELGLGECESLGSKCSQNGYSLSLGLNAASTIAANQRSGFSHLFKGCADYFLLLFVSSYYYLFLLIIIFAPLISSSQQLATPNEVYCCTYFSPFFSSPPPLTRLSDSDSQSTGGSACNCHGALVARHPPVLRAFSCAIQAGAVNFTCNWQELLWCDHLINSPLSNIND